MQSLTTKPANEDSLSLVGAEALPSRRASITSIDFPSLPPPRRSRSRSRSRTRALTPIDWDAMLGEPKNVNNVAAIDSLAEKMKRWKTYRQEFEDSKREISEKHKNDKDLFSDFEDEMSGTGNPFSHLRPKGI